MGGPSLDSDHLIEGWYTIPAPGSGNAGGDYCSVREPVVRQAILDSTLLGEFGIDRIIDLGTSYDPFSWPCTWDKLHEGESVTIPLYSVSGSVVYNPGFSYDEASGVINKGGGIGLDDFEIRVRAACDPSLVTHGNGEVADQICKDAERYQLAVDPLNSREITVLWEITGEEMDDSGKLTGQTVTLQQYFNDQFNNSYIGPTRINNYATLGGITQNSKPSNNIDDNTLASIIKYLHNDPSTDPIQNINKPVLKLISIHTLRTSDGTPIPYLEYQFRTKLQSGSLPPIANVSKVIEAEVMIDGGFTEKIERKISLPKPATGYVIQQ